MQVPCGKCLNCRIAHSREWATRCVHESTLYEKNVFVGLSYNDEHLPANKSLVPDHLRLFIKNFRRSLYPRKIKYFGCGEYGDIRDRPHYHIIMFNVGHDDFDSFVNTYGKKYYTTPYWKKGFVDVGFVSYHSARYVADYVFKKYTGKLGQHFYDKTGRVVPFQVCSQGIGKQYCLNHADFFRKALLCEIGKDSIVTDIPRYYKKLLDIPTEQLFARSIEKNKEKGVKFLERAIGKNMNVNDAFHEVKGQEEKNILARTAFYKKRKL